MRDTSDFHDLLLDYKRGKLSAKHREKIDEQIIADQEFSDRLAEAEYDLLDDYCAGRLTRTQRRNMERAFSAEELRRARPPVKGVIARPIAAAPQTRSRLTFAATVAASILVLAAGYLWSRQHFFARA